MSEREIAELLGGSGSVTRDTEERKRTRRERFEMACAVANGMLPNPNHSYLETDYDREIFAKEVALTADAILSELERRSNKKE